MKLTKANTKAIKYACLNFHYAKSVPTVQYAYNVYNDKDEWCGVIIYGGGANNNLAKSFGLKNGEILELERVALNGKQEQTSKALSLSLKLLHKENPLVKVIVSYADHRQNHVGTIYKATNWTYLGISETSDFQYLLNGKWTHQRTIDSKKNKEELKNKLKKRQNSNKFKYVYFFNQDLKNEYLSKSKEYPNKDDLTKKD